MTKSNLELNGLFGLQVLITVIEGKQGRNWSSGHGETPLISKACFLWLAQFASRTAKDHLPRGDATHSGLVPPTSIRNEGKDSFICLGIQILVITSKLYFENFTI